MTCGKLDTTEAVNLFMFAGKATITLKSKATENRFTYKVEESDDGRCHFVKVLTGQDNESAYTYLGLFRGGQFSHDRKERIKRDAPSAKAFSWFASHLSKPSLPDKLEVWHEGKCGACGRKLTVPASIACGIGPECAKKRGIELCEGVNEEKEDDAFNLDEERTFRDAQGFDAGQGFQAFSPDPAYIAQRNRYRDKRAR